MLCMAVRGRDWSVSAGGKHRGRPAPLCTSCSWATHCWPQQPAVCACRNRNLLSSLPEHCAQCDPQVLCRTSQKNMVLAQSLLLYSGSLTLFPSLCLSGPFHGTLPTMVTKAPPVPCNFVVRLGDFLDFSNYFSSFLHFLTLSSL